MILRVATLFLEKQKSLMNCEKFTLNPSLEKLLLMRTYWKPSKTSILRNYVMNFPELLKQFDLFKNTCLENFLSSFINKDGRVFACFPCCDGCCCTKSVSRIKHCVLECCSWAFSRREFSIVHRGEQKSLACMGANLRGARGQDFAFALYLFKVRGTAVPLRHASDRERTAEPKETRAGRRLHQNTSAENTSCFPWQQCRWTGGEPSKPTRVSRSTNLKHTNHKSTENGTSRQKVYSFHQRVNQGFAQVGTKDS